MQEDFLQQLGYVGFTARIKRISDNLLYDARRIYEELQIGIEPNWHLVFLVLKQEKRLTVTEIAQRLRFSHPAIIKIINKMKAHGFVKSNTHISDSRKQLVELTEKGVRELPLFEKEWDNIQQVVGEFVDEDFLEKLAGVEEKLSRKGLFERFKITRS